MVEPDECLECGLHTTPFEVTITDECSADCTYKCDRKSGQVRVEEDD